MNVKAVDICYNQQRLRIDYGQSLLEAALQHNLSIANSCRSGICQTCLVKITEGDIPPDAQKGLNHQQIQQNFALACQLKPQAFLNLESIDQQNFAMSQVVGHDKLNKDVLRLRLQVKQAFNPGQYLTIWQNEYCGRPYSIASLNQENILEFHIKRHESGQVSRWLHDEIVPGAELTISDAKGQCFYHPGLGGKTILLIGSGTGLAPLWGICRDALQQNHDQAIHLVTVNRKVSDLYLHTQLKILAAEYARFSYQAILTDDEYPDCFSGNVLDHLQLQYSKLQNWCIFICGAPKLVQKLQRQCFVNGASLGDIFTDPFLTRYDQT